MASPERHEWDSWMWCGKITNDSRRIFGNRKKKRWYPGDLSPEAVRGFWGHWVRVWSRRVEGRTTTRPVLFSFVSHRPIFFISSHVVVSSLPLIAFNVSHSVHIKSTTAALKYVEPCTFFPLPRFSVQLPARPFVRLVETMTFASDGFVSSPDCFILPTSPSSPSNPACTPIPALTHGPLISWSSYYTPNRCTCIPKPHDPPRLIHPASGPCPRQGRLLPLNSLNMSIHRLHQPTPIQSTLSLFLCCAKTPHRMVQVHPPAPLSSTLLPSSPSTTLTQPSESPLTSHTSIQHLPLSPPPSLPMVPHPLPVAPTITDTDAHTDTDLDLDLEVNDAEPVADPDSQSSSPDESASTDLLTPLSPIWDLPLDEDADVRPAGTLEVSTLMSRSLVSPLVRYGSLGNQATDGDRMTLASGSYQSLRDLDPKIESRCGQLCSLVVPPDGLVSARFSMVHTLFPPTSMAFLPDGHSQFSSGGKPSVDSHSFNLLLSHTDISPIPHFFQHRLVSLRPRLLLPNLEDPTHRHKRRDSDPLLTPG
jgi:hypothetical protein